MWYGFYVWFRAHKGEDELGIVFDGETFGESGMRFYDQKIWVINDVSLHLQRSKTPSPEATHFGTDAATRPDQPMNILEDTYVHARHVPEKLSTV